MKKNILSIQINRSVKDVFDFTITPPNSTKWIPGIVDEKANEWPVKIGTIYMLSNSDGSISEVIVVAIKTNKNIEWISNDKSYHCRYEYTAVDNQSCKLDYIEWVDYGNIVNPFSQDVLNSLKSKLEENQENKQITYSILQVFVNNNGEYGNPVGIIIDDKQKFSADIRQKIAAKIGFSESVFINNLNTGNISLFNPIKEVNFAGHAIIGTAYYISHKLGKKLNNLECKIGKVDFWMNEDITWIHAGIKGTPPWRHEQLNDPKVIDSLSLYDMASKEPAMVWAWIDEKNGVVRARTFASDWGIPEDQGNGSGSMQLAVKLGKTLEIHHGIGSIIYAKPTGTDYANIGGIVKEDTIRTINI